MGHTRQGSPERAESAERAADPPNLIRLAPAKGVRCSPPLPRAPARPWSRQRPSPRSRRARSSAPTRSRREQGRRPGHPRLVRAAQAPDRALRPRVRLPPRRARRRRRRHADQQARADPGRPHRRRRLRRRQHLRDPRPRRGRLRAVRRVAAAGREPLRPVPGDDHRLAPIDNGNVCVNVDTTWFRSHHVPRPARSTTSSSRRTRTCSRFPAPPPAPPVWRSCSARSASTATGGRRTGRRCWPTARRSPTAGRRPTRPTSPRAAATATCRSSSPTTPRPRSPSRRASTTSTTKALLDTCFRQVEYAGVLAGAQNVKGAEAFVDFLLSPEVQRALPDAMYVFPVRSGTPLPAAWARYAVQPTAPVHGQPRRHHRPPRRVAAAVERHRQSMTSR